MLRAALLFCPGSLFSRFLKQVHLLTMELKNMSRGLHTIIATVVDKDGNDLIKTEPVSFHVLRVGGG
jgi:hypothetical protein